MSRRNVMQFVCNKMASYWVCLLALLSGRVLVTRSFSVTTSTPEVKVSLGAAADLYCEYSADFGEPRVEWKFRDLQESQTFVYYNKEITKNYQGRVDFSPRVLHFKETQATDSGKYICDVNTPSGTHSGTAIVTLIVKVPPTIPTASVPTSVRTGSTAELKCLESKGYPRPSYRWYRDQVLMPEKPASSPTFRNSSYIIQSKMGLLTFNPVSKSDAGEYVCEASNNVGEPVKSSPPIRMEVYDTNVGGIVAGVIVALLILAFLGIGIWFAYRKGYLGQRASDKPKVIYSQPAMAEPADDGDFRQKSSFVV